MNFIKKYFIRRILKKHAISYSEWHNTTIKLPLLQHLSNKEKVQLRKLSTLFLYKKTIVGAKILKSQRLYRSLLPLRLVYKFLILDGMPPLHPNMPIEQWSQALSQAYELLNNNLDNFQHSYINPYASTNPAEFFAVISEYFFTAPDILFQYCPDVYEQLKQYYRQDTLPRSSLVV